MLTLEYIQNNRPIDFGVLSKKFNFFGRGLYKLDNGNFYLRRDHHLINDLRLNTQIQVYELDNDLYAYFPNSNMQTRVEGVNIIESETTGEFTGFSPGKRYILRNGQIWEQIDGVNSNCQPGGIVLIKDERLMQIGNWNFEIAVRRIQ